MTKEMMVNVCTLEKQEKTGTRTVCDYKTEAVTHKVKTCVMVPYQETVMVPECPVSDCGQRMVSRRSGCCN